MSKLIKISMHEHETLGTISNLGLPSHLIRTTKSGFIDSLMLNGKPCCTTINSKVYLKKYSYKGKIHNP